VILSATNPISLLSNQFRKSRIWFSSAISSVRTLVEDKEAGESKGVARTSE